jgi:hypothetical protein
MVKKLKPKIVYPVYPCFESELECEITFSHFKKDEFYLIEGFGKGKGNTDVWYIIDMSNPNIRFVVKKETMRIMFDTSKLIFKREEKKVLDR